MIDDEDVSVLVDNNESVTMLAVVDAGASAISD
jgi:hypothetical protein